MSIGVDIMTLLITQLHFSLASLANYVPSIQIQLCSEMDVIKLFVI